MLLRLERSGMLSREAVTKCEAEEADLEFVLRVITTFLNIFPDLLMFFWLYLVTESAVPLRWLMLVEKAWGKG